MERHFSSANRRCGTTRAAQDLTTCDNASSAGRPAPGDELVVPGARGARRRGHGHMARPPLRWTARSRERHWPSPSGGRVGRGRGVRGHGPAPRPDRHPPDVRHRTPAGGALARCWPALPTPARRPTGRDPTAGRGPRPCRRLVRPGRGPPGAVGHRHRTLPGGSPRGRREGPRTPRAMWAAGRRGPRAGTRARAGPWADAVGRGPGSSRVGRPAPGWGRSGPVRAMAVRGGGVRRDPRSSASRPPGRGNAPARGRARHHGREPPDRVTVRVEAAEWWCLPRLAGPGPLPQSPHQTRVPGTRRPVDRALSRGTRSQHEIVGAWPAASRASPCPVEAHRGASLGEDQVRRADHHAHRHGRHLEARTWASDRPSLPCGVFRSATRYGRTHHAFEP